MTGSNSSGSTHDGVPDCRDEGFPNELATLKTILGHVDDFLAHFDDSVFIIETKEEIYKNAEGIVACGRNALTVAHQLCVGFRYLPELPEKSAALRNRIIDNALRIEDEIYRILEVRNLELLPAADKSEVACAQRLVACADHVKVCPFLASIKKDRQLLLARCHEIVSANRTAADFACNQSSN